MDRQIKPGLDLYWDSTRIPHCYQSYPAFAGHNDRYYDDNDWVAIDFCDYYERTGDKEYLEKAIQLHDYIYSGWSEELGGGIYWCEQKKESKNTCSNAPGSVFALKLFKATQDSSYFEKGKSLYEWTKATLQDTTDCLYFDNMRLDGEIGRAKFAYNSGQMMQAAALLYQITKQKSYLEDAQNIAEACHKHFFTQFTSPDGQTFQLLKKGNIWFTAVMLRGFIELYQIDHNKTYLTDFQRSLDYAWHHARDERGLFQTDWSGTDKNEKKWLLTQAAFIEMYGRLGGINLQ
mgnify:CR=1 FL=1